MSTTETQTVVDVPVKDVKIVSQNEPSAAPIENGRESRTLEMMGIEEPPENATVFTTPNVKDVKAKMISTNFALFAAGMNDAATGALIPYLQPAYDIGLLFVALIYLVNFSGFIFAAFTNVHVTARIGMGGVLTLGACLQASAYALTLWKPPYPLFVLSFFFSGMGVAYQDAQVNTFGANVENSHRWLALMHAMYGTGALVSPLIATALASNTPYWHYFYAVMLGVAVINACSLAYTFRKGLFKQERAGAKDTATAELKDALSQRSTWTISLFFFLYVGAGVTTGGWVVEFLIRVKEGEAGKVGYVASGFWAGLTLGRLVLAEPTHRLGERRMVFVYTVIALALQLMYWFVPNIIANAVFVSFLGFVIGPFFPIGLNILTKLLRRELHTAAIGFAATFGQAGSAAFPFLTGAVASSKGVIVLQPIMVGLLAGMAILWALVPSVKRPVN